MSMFLEWKEFAWDFKIKRVMRVFSDFWVCFFNMIINVIIFSMKRGCEDVLRYG